MDKTDYRILTILGKNGRESASSIGKQIPLSVSAVTDRIRKLEETGVITGYTVMVDPRKLGNDVTALMEVSLEHPRYYDAFTEEVRRHPSIVDCYYLTGDFDFNLKLICSSSEELERIHREIKSMPGVSATRTHYVLKEVKNIYTALPGLEDQDAKEAEGRKAVETGMGTRTGSGTGTKSAAARDGEGNGSALPENEKMRATVTEHVSKRNK